MHKAFMIAALEAARLGRGSCSPNPAVGAVLVHENTIVARSWHEGAGMPHAEQRLLAEVEGNIKGMTLYVTLEPCNHWGKTPPCVSGIIDRGISRVVFGFSDPNPLVSKNNTPRILRESGIEVIHCPLPEIDDFYKSYDHWTKTKKPWLTAKIAQSLDGKIGMLEARVLISNTQCQQFTHRQRKHTDIILTTAKTIIADNPLLNVRIEEKEEKKPVAILDRRLSLPMDTKIFRNAAHCHVYYDAKIAIEKRIDNCSYHALPVIDDRLDLKGLMEHLGGLGFHDVWVEAGGTLFTALHQEGLVQTTYLYIAPVVLGSHAINGYLSPSQFNRPFKILWQIMADNVIACIQWQEA